jgi:MoaA/NifB/PqqE/SkfB family radical SAM enzyme
MLKKGWYKRAYNFIFVTYFVRGEDCGKGVLDPLWFAAPKTVPAFWDIELEVTTACPLSCRHCVPSDTMILGFEPKPIQEAWPGEKVLGIKGNETIITEVMDRPYSGELVYIHAKGVLPFRVTPEHRIYASKRTWNKPHMIYDYAQPEFITASELTKEYAVIFPKLKEVKKWAEPFEYSDELMEFLGYYVAEGSIANGTRSSGFGQKADVTLTFNKNETELIDRSIYLIKKLFNRHVYKCLNATAIQLRFSHVGLANWIDLNIGKTAYKKRLPDCVMSLDSKTGIKSFLDAYIAGDGNISENYAQITSSSKGMALQTQKLLTKLDIFGRIYQNKKPGIEVIQGRTCNTHGLYQVRMTRPDYDLWLGNQVINTRQYYQSTHDYFALPIHELKKEQYQGTVYNLETPDHAFEVNNVVIHNCEHTYFPQDYRNQNLTLIQFKNIIDSIPKLKWINMTGEGSPFMNPEFMAMLRYAKSKDIYIDFSHDFYTYNDKIGRELIELGIERIYFSIDGCTKETYEKVRIGSDFERVIKNIRSFIALKKEMKSPLPEICYRFAFFKDNWREVPWLPKLVHDLGDVSDEPSINFVGLLEFEQTKGLEVELPGCEKELADQVAKDYGQSLYWSHVTHDEAKKAPCHFCVFWTEPYIMISGHVVPDCAVLMSNRRPFLESNSFGNVNDMSLIEMWNTPKYRQFRETLRNPKAPVPSICLGCRVYETQFRAKKYGVWEMSK